MKRSPAALAVLVAVLFAGTAFAQTRPRRVDPPSGGEAATGDAPVDLEGDLIEVPVVVADRTGRYVANLRQQDFELLEDGRPQAITFFRSERVPIHVALLVDTSLSTRFSLGEIQEAAVDFVNQLLPGDEVMVVSFAGAVTIEQEFTSDRRRLIAAIRGTHPTWGTKLYEAVYRTVADRLRQIDGRKAVVLLSDGQDVGSDVESERAVGVCDESDVAVYGIRYPRAADRNRDAGPLRRMPRFPLVAAAEPQFGAQRRGGRRNRQDPFMETVTSSSGGTLYQANAVSDIRALFGKIAEDLRHVYVLGYAPSTPLSAGGYRAISVRVPSKPEAAVRHRLGYQAGAHP